MKLIIEDELLKNVLEKKKNEIGTSWYQAIPNIGSGIGFYLTATGVDLSKISSKIGFNIDIIFFLFSIVLIALGILQLVKSIGKNHYDHQKLYQDILKLNKDKHLYSLVAIKNTFDEYSNKFLLYYDEEWQVEFFPAFRTVNNDVYNIDNIKKRLSENLKIKADKIDVTFLIEKTNQTKPSAEDEIEKVYDHRYYQATISEFPDCLKESTTIIDGRRYIWMTFQDMKKNTNIMKKNKDIIQIFEEYIK